MSDQNEVGRIGEGIEEYEMVRTVLETIRRRANSDMGRIQASYRDGAKRSLFVAVS